MLKDIHTASKDTQREIAELAVSDTYFSSFHKSSFFEVNDNTQKEIAELVLKENYSLPSFSSGKTTRDFDGLHIKTIKEFLVKQAKKNKEFFSQKSLDFHQQERELTDQKSLNFILAKGEFAGFNPKSIKYSKHKSDEIRGFDKEMISKIKDNEQRYLKNELSNQVLLSRALVDLGSNYQIQL